MEEESLRHGSSTIYFAQNGLVLYSQLRLSLSCKFVGTVEAASAGILSIPWLIAHVYFVLRYFIPRWIGQLYKLVKERFLCQENYNAGAHSAVVGFYSEKAVV